MSRCGYLSRLACASRVAQGRTPSDRMLPNVIGGPGGEGINIDYRPRKALFPLAILLASVAN